jgi:hypothetical protein
MTTEELYRRMKVAERLLDDARQNFGAAAAVMNERSDEFQVARRAWLNAVESEAQRKFDADKGRGEA